MIFNVFFTYEYGFFVVLLSAFFFAMLFRAEATRIKPNLIDMGFIGFEVFSMASYFFSINKNNSLAGIVESFTLLLLYFLLRISFQRQRNKIRFIHLIGYFILTVLLANAAAFRNYTFNVAGMLDEAQLGNFKYLYRPFGILLNDWVGILLSFIPFLTLIVFRQKDKRKISTYSVALGAVYFFIITSFSRAALYSLLIFSACFLFLLCLHNKKAVTGKPVVIIAAIAILPLIFFTRDVLDTLLLFATPSQNLSFEGRMALWKNVSLLINDHPFFGIGTKNFPLYFSSFRDFTLIATNKVSNTYLQILIENGIVGFIGMVFLFSTVFIKCGWLYLREQRGKVITILFFSYFFAVLFREFFFNSLFSNHWMSLLFVVLLAYIGSLRARRHTCGNIFGIVCVAGATSFWIVFPQFKKLYADRYNDSGIELAGKNKWEDANTEFGKAIRFNPHNAIYYANKGISFERLYNKERTITEIMAGEKMHPSFLPYLDSAIVYFEKALNINPKDDLFNHNLGWLTAMKNNKNAARYRMDLSIRYDPSVAYYYVSRGILYEKDNRTDSAKLMYRKALELSPNLIDSEFFNSLKKRMPADSIVMQAIQEEKSKPSKNGTYLSRLGILLFYAGSAEAERYLSNAVEELPYMNRSYLYLGAIDWHIHKDEKKAEKYLLKAYKLDKEDYKAANWLSEFYSLRGDTLNAAYFKKMNPYPINKSKHSISAKMIYQASSINDELVPTGYFGYMYK